MKNSKYRVLADADLILEFFVNRDKYIEDVETFIEMITSSSRFSVYITDKCLKRLNLENDDKNIAKEAVDYISGLFESRIIEINHKIREEARQLDIIDLDSAQECVCVSTYSIDAIITLNSQNFDGSPIPVWSIKDYLIREKLNRTITINIPAFLQKLTNQQASVQVSGRTIGDLIESLEMVAPGIKARLLDEQGNLRRFVNFYVNNEDIRFLEGINTPIEDGDEVSIIPAIAGG
jgi:sulfur-carrier protein